MKWQIFWNTERVKEKMKDNQDKIEFVNKTQDLLDENSLDNTLMRENIATNTGQVAALNVGPVSIGLDGFYKMPTYNKSDSYENEKKRESYTGLESVFAWMSFVFGFIFCKVFPAHMNSLGAFLLVLLLFAATTVVLKVKKAEFGVMSVIIAVSAVVVSAILILSSNEMQRSLANTYAMIAYCYYIYSANGNATKKGFNDFIVADFFKALFVAPFMRIGSMIKGMFFGKAKKSGDVIGRLVKGGFIALIPTVVVCGLLSYDKDFSRIIGNMFSFDAGVVFSNIWSLCMGILIGQYIFKLFITSSDKACQDRFTEEECMQKANKLKRTHVVTALAAVLPILFLYVVFFISQWKYYMSAFSGKLPEDLSYADYAREGFFQLCTVSVINMIIIVFVEMFTDVSKVGIAKVKKSVVITYSVFTLILIATAISKMMLYINSYGLTPKRVYSSWLMIMLAMIFVIVIAKQFVEKIQAVAVSFVVVVVMFAALSLSNMAGYIARYNVNRYLEGSLENVDVRVMRDLGDAAVPELVYLMDCLEKRGADQGDSSEWLVYERVKSTLEDMALDYANNPREIMAYTVPYLKAIDAMEDTGFMDMYN